MFLGIFFIPNNTFACCSEKQSCEKELSTTKTKEKSCCDNNNDNKECNGKNIYRCYSWYDIYNKIKNIENRR